MDQVNKNIIEANYGKLVLGWTNPKACQGHLEGMGFLTGFWASCIQKGYCGFQDAPPWLETGLPDAHHAADFQAKASPAYFMTKFGKLTPNGRPSGIGDMHCRAPQMQQHVPLTVTERLSQAIAAMAKAGYLKTNDAAGLKLMWSAGGELAQSIERAVLMEWDQGYAENVATLEAILQQSKYTGERFNCWLGTVTPGAFWQTSSPRIKHAISFIVGLPQECDKCSRHFYSIPSLAELVNSSVMDSKPDWHPFTPMEIHLAAHAISRLGNTEIRYDRHGVGSCLDVMPDLSKSRIVLLCNE
jgi:hypothetical protein